MIAQRAWGAESVEVTSEDTAAVKVHLEEGETSEIVMLQREDKRASGTVDRAVDRALAACDRTSDALARMAEVADVVADRHIRGGLIGFLFPQQAIAMELWGRSGGLMHVGFDRPFKQERSDAQKKLDVGIVGYDRPAGPRDLEEIAKFRARCGYVIGFGPRQMPGLQPIVGACDAWFDAGPDAVGGGLDVTAANAIGAWAFTAELIGALSRQGRMPTMWKSYAYDDAREWSARYLGKQQFHDDFSVPRMLPAEMGKKFLAYISGLIRQLGKNESARLADAGRAVAAEVSAGRKVIVAWQGHMPPAYIGKFADAWAVAAEMHPALAEQLQRYAANTPNGALVISLGYHGLDARAVEAWKRKNQRVFHFCGASADAAHIARAADIQSIDLGFEFGDACVKVEGYPIRVLPPSGIMQVVAYEAIVEEATRRIAATPPPPRRY